MDIILTQKDADFILKYIRANLENISDARSEIQRKYKVINEQFNKKLKDNELAKELMSFTDEFTSMIDDATRETKEELEKCVLLLTVGSEVSK